LKRDIGNLKNKIENLLIEKQSFKKIAS
jgi:hypothetical protein